MLIIFSTLHFAVVSTSLYNWTCLFLIVQLQSLFQTAKCIWKGKDPSLEAIVNVRRNVTALMGVYVVISSPSFKVCFYCFLCDAMCPKPVVNKECFRAL